MRNSIKYVPSKDYKAFAVSIKKLYGAPSLKAAQTEFEKFKQTWSTYPGAVDVWVKNFAHVEQLFDYGSAVRKVMYTTNAVESVNSTFRKVAQKGAFPNEDALLKLLYLRVTVLTKNGIIVQLRIGLWSETTLTSTPFSKNESENLLQPRTGH